MLVIIQILKDYLIESNFLGRLVSETFNSPFSEHTFNDSKRLEQTSSGAGVRVPPGANEWNFAEILKRQAD